MIYILCSFIRYEGKQFEGVFSSLEKAQDYARKLSKIDDLHGFIVHMPIIDDPSNANIVLLTSSGEIDVDSDCK